MKIQKTIIEEHIFEVSKSFTNLSEFLIHLYYKIFNVYPKKFYLKQCSKEDGIIIGEYDKSSDNHEEDDECLNFDSNKFCEFCEQAEENNNMYIYLHEGDFYTYRFVIGENFIFVLPRLNDSEWDYFSVLSEDISYVEKLKKHIVLSKNQNSSIKYYFVLGSQQGFKIRPMFLEKDKIAISLEDNYNDDLPIKEIENFINNQFGIFIFNGIPGTGKSSLLKYLISTMKNKQFMWMDSDLLVNINSESFINFIVDEAKDSIIILEDCEKLLTDRKLSYNQNLGTLLNISDGILGDSLKLKFICTFNSDLRNIDPAVLRKGRLKGKYEFKKLSINKTNNLCKKLGISEINCESTLAEIYNNLPVNFGEQTTTKIGF